MTRSLFLWSLLLGGCLPAVPPLDADHDGWDWPEDCDDDDAAVHPEAEETWYDGIDQDCDGASDHDADADGFDAAASGGEDCVDNAADVHPGATEQYYDGTDQDCDGRSDFDQDRDGYDCEALVSPGCPETSTGEDCDDTIPAVHPGAEEVENGDDDDCDGQVDEANPDGPSDPVELSTRHDALLGEDDVYYGFGASFSDSAQDVVSTMDLAEFPIAPSPDGHPDLLISAPLAEVFLDLFSESCNDIGGAAYLVATGPTYDLEGVPVRARTALRMAAPDTESLFGAQLAWLPSLDGDTTPDILVGAPALSNGSAAGHAWIFPSDAWPAAASVTTSTGTLHELNVVDHALNFSTSEPSDGFGLAASLGDWDGDGKGDVAIGAPYGGAHMDASVRVEPGRVYLYSSATIAGAGIEITTSDATTTLLGSLGNQHLGGATPVLADLNADGTDDLLVSAATEAGEQGLVAALDGGTPFGTDLLVSDLDHLLTGESSVLRLGMRLAGGGDMDGDGHADLAVLAGTNAGTAQVFVVSGAAWTDSVDATLSTALLLHVTDFATFTTLDTMAMSLAGSFDGDDQDDLVIGSIEGSVETLGGVVEVFYGGAGHSGVVAPESADLRYSGGEYDLLGCSEVGSVDVTGDGLPELLLGAPGLDSPSKQPWLRSGALYLFDPVAGW